MSSKNKKALPIVIVALIAIAGAGYFLYQKSAGMGDGMTTASAPAPAAADNNAATQQAAVETAAGNADAGKPQQNAPQLSGEQLTVIPGNPVVAKVDGKDIFRTDVYRFIQTMPPNVQQMPAVTVYPMAMEQVINTRIVQTKADEANITESEQFAREMEMAKQQIARNLFIQQEVDKKISDDKLKKKYDALLKETPDVEERRARHILLETEDKAKAVIKQLQAGGNFEELAKELSKGPTGPKGGDLGYFAKGEMVPEFSDKAFSMKPGDVSQEPVKTQFGFHVIKLEDVRERPKPQFEQVKSVIEAEMRREVLAEMMEDWRKKAKIEQFDINGDPLKKGANATGLVPPESATN